MPVQPLRPIAKRTTIYLPATIKLTKPTAEINEHLKHLHDLLSTSEEQICIATIHKLFSPILETKSEMNSYQIVIQQEHRKKLAVIRQRTGLTVSDLVRWCFSENMKQYI